jgi:plasmid stability protein
MAQLLVRNVPDEVVEALKRRAKANGHSVEEEHRLVLAAALNPALRRFIERAAKLREETRGRIKTDYADLIRADRDSR